MTVVVDQPQTQPQQTAVVLASPQPALAPWHKRAGAFAVDVVLGSAVVATMAVVSFTVAPRGAWWWVCIVVIGLLILLMSVNRVLLPTILGYSLGRGLFGITVVKDSGEPSDAWRLLLRELAHLLDTAAAFVGWLWPLWDSRNRTFADLLLHTESRVDPQERPADLRRWTAVAASIAAAACLAGAAVSYGVVYSCDRAIDQTRSEINTQGPKMVAQMLTYDPKTLHDDFARARSLATDRYRGQLAAQQDAVEKGGHPVVNEYWPRSGAIQSATPDRATMLLFLQGRRGVAPDERYISATVRVTFAKGSDDQWRIDDLNVITKPRPPGEGR
ncbi:RDD family protein [Mycobacterium kubicae]|uniref:RDD family protein n=2 Tax=Mycobacterium kubicae TaxID=120959 RepID=A0AAX1JD65_9MYCO|nr:RDD family protein [Mycobacterium kubicae]MCV7097816.1 RDD family protein [Mycobacterium kubicae]ORW06070.1 hypothetical protein AWC13_24290 [Mycobacterium kubicae]QNI10217.1 RDD family protein [Mycobacterium kubicae]QPI38422.1 RDD family protein [Mycobacterium kubicae]